MPGEMTRCAECGTRVVPGQSFCDACGAVLSWAESTAGVAGRADATGQAGVAGQAGLPGQAGMAGLPGQAGLAGQAGVSVPAGTAPGNPVWPDPSHPDPAHPEPAHTEPAEPATSLTAPPASPAGPVPPTASLPPTAYLPPTESPAPTGSAPDEATAAGGTAPVGRAVEAGGTTAAMESDLDTTAERARALFVPVTDTGPEAAPQAVTPVLPGRPAAHRPQVRAPGQQPDIDGGVPCPWCGTANRPDRHFCARCALSMSRGGAAPERRRPWWRRLLDGRGRPTPYAGERPRLRYGFGRLLRWLAGAVVLALLIVAGLHAGAGVQAVRDHFAKRAPLRPNHFTASRSYSGHPPKLVFDKLNDTWWGPGVTESGAGQWLEARFDQPQHLLDVIITPGVSTREDEVSKLPLPHRIEARISTADGRTSTRMLSLDEGAGDQHRSFRVSDVIAVRFILRTAYGATPDKQVSIAEIEFFGPSQGGGS